MGIRFLCHNCQKRLNVKSTQAGTEGQCPRCKQLILVPLQSSIASTLEKENQAQRSKDQVLTDDRSVDLLDIDDQPTIEGLAAGRKQVETIDLSDVNKNDSIDFSDDDDSSHELFMLDKPTPPPTFGKIDPIAEAPDRVWYFRSREMGEKGPLKAKAMQEHLDRGDVTVGCTVWREDWEDWTKAELAFPKLRAEARAQRRKARVFKAFKESTYDLPEELDPKSEFNRRIRRKNRIFFAMVTLGIILIIGLTFLLVYLLNQ